MPNPDPQHRTTARHRAVMPREVLDWLDLKPGLTVVDGTFGGGGHSRLIVEHIMPDGTLIGLDRDPDAVRVGSQNDQHKTMTLRQSSYADLRDVLNTLDIDTVDRILVDLGLSSDQLSDHDRGFSFESDGPLDLRFNPAEGISAAEWIATATTSQIESALDEYAEEPFSGRIAAALHRIHPQTGRELSEAVQSALPSSVTSNSRKNPATRTFQALRIVVNSELAHLSRAVHKTFPSCLSQGGRLVAIAFHSIEDRILKHALQGDESWRMLTRKPLTPTPSEMRHNPRSRSARIRVAQRI